MVDEYDFIKEAEDDKENLNPQTPEVSLIDGKDWNSLLKAIQTIINKEKKDLIDMSIFAIPVSSPEELDTPFIMTQINRVVIRKLTSSRIQVMTQNRQGSFNLFKKFFKSWNVDPTNAYVFIRMRGLNTFVLTFQ